MVGCGGCGTCAMAHDLLSIVGDIEDAIVARLQGGITGVQEFNLTDDATMVRCPAVNVAMFDGTLRPLTRTKYQVDAGFYVTLIAANPRSSRDRRRAVYPLLMAAMSLLGHWRPVLVENTVEVDLGASELLLGRFNKVLDEADRIAFSAVVRCGFGFAVPEDEALVDVLAIGLSHVLKPGGDTPVVVDEVEIETDD